MKELTQSVEKALEQLLPSEEITPGLIHKAMRYSMLAGGKRIRPVLCLASCEAVGGNADLAIPFACALELIHTYSLIHDDLPCMDNDDFRRGRLTNHKVFGEGIAVLAGDALLTMAFEWMSTAKGVSDSCKVRTIQELSSASGSQGLIGGQVMDLTSEGKPVDAKTLEYIHLHKTSCLIEASVKIGALVGEASDQALQSIAQYGRCLGLAFQITDDLLDVVGNAEKMGKAVRKDADHAKATYPSIHGIEASRKMVEDLVREGFKSLDFLGERADFLKAILKLVQERDH